MRFIKFFGLLIILASSSSLAARSTVKQTNLEVSGAFATTAGSYAGNFLAGISFRIDASKPLRMGISSGIMFGSGTGLPILFSMIHEFSHQMGSLQPYIGGSIGPVIGVSSSVIGGAFDQGNTIELAILVRPGFRHKLSDSMDLMVEVPFGGITGVFYIAPTLGAVVHL